jgi:hypothetical protein
MLVIANEGVHEANFGNGLEGSHFRLKAPEWHDDGGSLGLPPAGTGESDVAAQNPAMHCAGGLMLSTRLVKTSK